MLFSLFESHPISDQRLFYPRKVGLGFLVGSFLSRSAQAVTAGFGERP
jgi:hypothetical protein